MIITTHLSTDIPYSELQTLAGLDCLHIETYRWNCGDGLIDLNLVKNRCLSGIVQAQHYNSKGGKNGTSNWLIQNKYKNDRD